MRFQNAALFILIQLSALQAQTASDFGSIIPGLWVDDGAKSSTRTEMEFRSGGTLLYSQEKKTPQSDGTYYRSGEYWIHADGDDDYYELTPPNILKIGFRDTAFNRETCIHYYAGYITSNRTVDFHDYLILVGQGGKMDGNYQNVTPLKNRYFEIDKYFGDVRFDAASKKAFLSVMGVVAEMDFSVEQDGLVAFSQRGSVIQRFKQAFRGDTLFLEEMTKSHPFTKEPVANLRTIRRNPYSAELKGLRSRFGFNVLGRRSVAQNSGAIGNPVFEAAGFQIHQVR